MKAFITAVAIITSFGLVWHCASRLAEGSADRFTARHIEQPVNGRPLPVIYDPVCSRSYTREQARRCAAKCYGTMLTSKALEDCALACHASADMYLAGCEMSGGVRP